MAEYDPGDKNLDPQLHEAVKKFDEARARGEDASLSWDAVNLPYGARVDLKTSPAGKSGGTNTTVGQESATSRKNPYDAILKAMSDEPSRFLLTSKLFTLYFLNGFTYLLSF